MHASKEMRVRLRTKLLNVMFLRYPAMIPAIKSLIEACSEDPSELETPIDNEPTFVPRRLFSWTMYIRWSFEVKNLDNIFLLIRKELTTDIRSKIFMEVN